MKYNDLIKILPTRINIRGDKVLAEQFIGPAKSQLAILKNQMTFQKLTQGIRRVQLAKNVFVECGKVFNFEFCTITALASPKVLTELIPEDLITILLIVLGNEVKYLDLTNVTASFISEETIFGSACSGTITSTQVYNETELTQRIYGDFTDCITSGDVVIGSNSYAEGEVDELISWYFQNNYEHYEFSREGLTYSNVIDKYPIFGAADNSLPAECTNNIVIENEWSKVLDQFMVTAFTYYDISSEEFFQISLGDYKYLRYWRVAASYNGEPVTFSGTITLRGTPGVYDKAVNFGDFYRTVNDATLSYANVPKTHIGFDLWKDEEGFYWLSIIDDQNAQLFEFKLDLTELDLVLQNTYSSTVRTEKYLAITELPPYEMQYGGPWEIGDPFYSITDAYRFVRLLGYGYDQASGNHIAYWGEPYYNFKHYSIVNRQFAWLFYCEEILNTGDITVHFLPWPENYTESFTVYPRLNTALWNPIKRKLYTSYQFYDAYLYTSGDYVMSAEFDETSIYDKQTEITTYYDTESMLNTSATYYYQLSPDSPYSSITLDCAAYVHPDENFFYTSTTWWNLTLTQPNNFHNLGIFQINNDLYEKGNKIQTKLLSDYSISFTSSNTLYCPDEYEEDNYLSGTGVDKYTLENAYDYELNKWIFTNDTDELVYEYQSNEMVVALQCTSPNEYVVGACETYANPLDCFLDDGITPCRGDDCYCEELLWVPQTVGNEAIINAASDEFPFDQGWTSILFSGTDTDKEVYTNWIIYKDITNDPESEAYEGYFAISDKGVKHALGKYDRAFFYHFTKTPGQPETY